MRPPDPPASSLTHSSAVPERSSVLIPSHFLRQWLLSTRAAGGGVASKVAAAGPRVDGGTTGPDRQAQMLKMISVLEEMQRTFNSTLGTRLTMLPRGEDYS